MSRRPMDDVALTSGKNASELLLERIAQREGRSPLEFDPVLYDVIDPEALDSLVTRATTDVTIEFSYLGYRVRVHGDGRIELRDD